MRKGLLGLPLLLMCMGAALAQGPAMNTAVMPPEYAGGGYPGVYIPVQDVAGLTDGGEPSGDGNRFTGTGSAVRNPLQDSFWVSGELMVWKIKNGPQPAALVRTGPTTAFPTGFAGQPGSSTVLGGKNLEYPTFSGGRLTGGWWFDPQNPFMGAELGVFLLERRSTSVAVNSDANGNPALSAPFFFPSAQTETAIPLAFPAAGGSPPSFAGGANLNSSSRLWGTDGNLLSILYRGDSARFTMMYGGRYLNLEESLVLAYHLTELPGGLLPFGGIFAPNTGTQASMTDNYQATTEFYGGQLGARFEWYFSRLFLNLTGKAALGVSHDRVEVSGLSTLLPGPGPAFPGPTSLAGGIYSAGGNTGVFKDNKFAMLSEVDAKFGIQIAYGFSAFIGYDVLYLTKAARVGDQINHSVDGTKIPVSIDFVPGGGGAPPALPVTQSTFWAQGVDLGLMFRY